MATFEIQMATHHLLPIRNDVLHSQRRLLPSTWTTWTVFEATYKKHILTFPTNWNTLLFYTMPNTTIRTFLPP